MAPCHLSSGLLLTKNITFPLGFYAFFPSPHTPSSPSLVPRNTKHLTNLYRTYPWDFHIPWRMDPFREAPQPEPGASREGLWTLKFLGSHAYTIIIIPVIILRFGIFMIIAQWSLSYTTSHPPSLAVWNLESSNNVTLIYHNPQALSISAVSI